MLWYCLPVIDNEHNEKLLQESILKARRLNKENKPLLIKINSYPSAGKTTFINKYNGVYRGCKLIDYDNLDKNGKQLTTDVFKTFPNAPCILFGLNDGTSEKEDIIYMGVFPSFRDTYRNVRRRIFQLEKGYWSNPIYILENRRWHFKKSQHDYIASDFKTPIDVVIDAYLSPT